MWNQRGCTEILTVLNTCSFIVSDRAVRIRLCIYGMTQVNLRRNEIGWAGGGGGGAASASFSTTQNWHKLKEILNKTSAWQP